LDGFGEVSWKQEEFALIWSKLGRFKKKQGELLGLFFFVESDSVFSGCSMDCSFGMHR